MWHQFAGCFDKFAHHLTDGRTCERSTFTAQPERLKSLRSSWLGPLCSHRLPGVASRRAPLSSPRARRRAYSCALRLASAPGGGGGAERLNVSDYDPKTGSLRIRAGKGNKSRMAYNSASERDHSDAWLRARSAGAPGAELAGALFCLVLRGGHVRIRHLDRAPSSRPCSDGPAKRVCRTSRLTTCAAP